MEQEEQARRAWKKWDRTNESCVAKGIASPPMPDCGCLDERRLTLWYIWQTRRGRQHIKKLRLSTAASLFEVTECRIMYGVIVGAGHQECPWTTCINPEKQLYELTEKGYEVLEDLACDMYQEKEPEKRTVPAIVKKVSVIDRIMEAIGV